MNSSAGAGLMVPVDGGAVWAQDTGGDGPPVVLLHPGIGDSRIWDPLVTALAGRYRLIRYDARGHDRSPAPAAAYTQLGDLRAVLDHFKLAEVTVVGCSMGGDSGLQLAIEDPARVRSLVLLCPGVTGYPWPAEPAEEAESEVLFKAADVAGLTDLGMRMWAAAGQDDAARAQLRSAAAGWLAEAGYEQEGPPVFDRLGEISAPAVLLIGDLDRQPLIDCAAATAAGIPGCRLVTVPGADHLLPLRAPGAVAQAIREQLG